MSITLALNLIRRISVSDRRIRSGFWKKETGNLIAGKTIGIVGLGRIGKKTASLYQSLGCTVIAYDLYPDREWMKSNDIENVTFNTLIKNANIISMDDAPSILQSKSSDIQIETTLPELKIVTIEKPEQSEKKLGFIKKLKGETPITEPEPKITFPVEKENPKTGEIITIDTFKVKESLIYLHKYLLANDKISGIKGYDESLLHIFSDKVLKMIKNGEQGWEKMVPKEVEHTIKNKNLFGFKAIE